MRQEEVFQNDLAMLGTALDEMGAVKVLDDGFMFIDETVALLLQLAVESSLHPRIDAMFRGEKINVTEKRAVLHVPLRSPEEEEIFAEGVNVVPQDSEGALA